MTMSIKKNDEWKEMSIHRYNNRNDEIDFEEDFDYDENVKELNYGLYEDLTMDTFSTPVDSDSNYINLWTSGCMD